MTAADTDRAHRSAERHGRRAAARCRTAAVVLATLAACAAGGTLVTSAQAATRSCVMPLEPQSDRENLVYPDTTVTYQGGDVPIPPGGHAEIKGLFPHARFFSLQTSGPNGRNINAWADSEIRPDAGSVNPFLVGADRTAADRSYTIRVLDAPVPSDGPARNTLYNASADGSARSLPGFALVVLRYYLPDIGLGRPAGVPAPKITLVTATGARIPVPDCPDPVGDPGITQALANTSPQGAVTLGPAAGAPVAHRVPVWRRYVNAPGAYAAALFDTDLFSETVYPQTLPLTAPLPAGLFENIYNKYVSTSVSTDFGQVLVLRAKLPTTPRTYDGEPRMGTGQLRYWSMCSNQTYTTAVYACLADKDVPVDADGVFTIAVSTSAARPANARAACGVGWLPTGLPGPTALIMRNMLPATDFAQAIQNVTAGRERSTMGDYYPVGRYYTTANEFERTGCHAPATTTAAGSSGPAKACPSTPARLTFRLRPPRGRRIVSASASVDGRRVIVRRGRALTKLVVRRPRRERFSVRIVSRLDDGTVRVSRRVYSGCGRKTAPVTTVGRGPGS